MGLALFEITIVIISTMYNPVEIAEIGMDNSYVDFEIKATRRGLLDIGAGNQVDLYCEQFGLRKYLNLFKLDDSKTYKNYEYESCKVAAKGYFTIMKEPDGTVIKFGTYCRDKGIKPNRCARVIYRLIEYGWDMESVMDLFENINIDYYIKSTTGYDEIFMYAKDWFRLKFGIFNLGPCLDEFNLSRINMIPIAVVESYKHWWLTNRDCKFNCIDVFGINKIYVAKKPAKLRIADYFSNFCLKEYNEDRTEVWTKQQYDCIAETSIYIDWENINFFLNTATEVSKVGWCNQNKNTHWTFDYICEFIGILTSLERDDFKMENYEQRVKLIAAAIKYGFSRAEFEKFIEKTDKINETFQSITCKYGILEAVFFVDEKDYIPPDKLKDYEFSFRVNYIFWEKNDKIKFNGHLGLLLDLFKYDKTTAKNCSDFTKQLKKIEDMFYKTKWPVEQLDGVLKSALDSGKSLNQVYDCLNTNFDNTNVCNNVKIKGC